ncbi:MAG: late control protein D [Gammaproteobacteria bacterium]|nr:late control protein D [Gammaproteobacteria bacterium]
MFVTVLSHEGDIEGRASEQIVQRLEAFRFEDSDKRADSIKMTLNNEDLLFFDMGEDVLGGTLLEVQWGYIGDMSAPRRGVIKKISGSTTLTVEARAESAQMHRITRSREWSGKTRAAVVREVAAENGYAGSAVSIEETVEPYETISQMGETDAAFLTRLAGLERFQFYVDDTGLHWHSRKFESQPTHVLEWRPAPGATSIPIDSWEPQSNLARRVGRVKLKSRDPETKKEIEATATSGDVERATLAEVKEVVDPETLEGTLVREEVKRSSTDVARPSAASTPERLKREAAARYRVAERESIKMMVSVMGVPSLRAKSVVELRGCSAMFDGLYFATDVTHAFGSSGYATELVLIRDGKNTTGAPAQAGSATPGAQQQGGDRNQQTANPESEPVAVEVVDPETLQTRIEYRRPPV